jgi:hypothetical protein
MHPSGPHLAEQPTASAPAQPEKPSDILPPEGSKTPAKNFDKNPAETTDVGNKTPQKGEANADKATTTNANTEENDTTSVSEANNSEEENALDADNGDSLVAADTSHVDTSVAAEAAEIGDNLGYEDGDEEKFDDGEEDAGQDLHVEESGCAPEEIPQELVSEFNKGNLIIKV